MIIFTLLAIAWKRAEYVNVVKLSNRQIVTLAPMVITDIQIAANVNVILTVPTVITVRPLTENVLAKSILLAIIANSAPMGIILFRSAKLVNAIKLVPLVMIAT